MLRRPLSLVLIVVGVLGWVAGAVYLVLVGSGVIATEPSETVTGAISLSQLLAAAGWGMSVEYRLGNMVGRLDQME